MRNIFELIKPEYESNNSVGFDFEDIIKIEEKIQYLILKKRYCNLGEFLDEQKKYYEDPEVDDDLKNLLFIYNDLKEINFIGTDLFANVMFIKNEVPYLYRSVGKDTNTEKVLGDEKYQYKNHVAKIMKECLNQIETGGKGRLFSYTKCFGKMLYKYATLQSENADAIIEIRKCANVNSVFDGETMSIQKYARKCASKTDEEESTLPYFCIDMSNARDNEVKYLKEWITDFLGKQEWYWHKDIVDPIGDAEVVCNFTNATDDNKKEILCNEVQRISFKRKQFCMLLYKYFETYAKMADDNVDNFNDFIKKSLETLESYEDGKFKEYYSDIIKFQEIDNKISEILKLIDWENEKKYMSRQKGEKNEIEVKVADMAVYKGNNAEPYSAIWKEILFEAVMGKYSYIDYGYSKK